MSFSYLVGVLPPPLAMSSGPSHFVVMATGQIEGAKFEGHDSLYCRYAFSMPWARLGRGLDRDEGG